MKKFENKSKNKKGKSHRFFGVSPKIQRSSNLLFPLQARGLEGIKCILNICACLRRLPHLRLAMTPYRHSERSEESSKINIKTWILRFAFAPLRMTMLALVLSISVTSESLAECNSGDFSCNGKSGASAYCCYHVVSTNTDGKKNIEIYRDAEAPADAVASVGDRAFWKNTTLASVSIGKGVTTIGVGAFYYSSVENVSMPYITTIGDIAFWGASLKTLDMPSLQKVITRGLPGNYPYISFPADAEVCMSGYGCMRTSNCRITKNEKGQDYKICGTCDDYVKSGTGCVKNCGKGYLGKEGKCIDAALGCGINYKDMGGFCNRVRYTPAEAAEIAKDDGNVVTITFRK